MSKYYKAEDVINAIEDKIAEYIPTLYGRYAEIPLELRMAIEHLPTIEVSEDAISREDAIKAYNEAVDELVKAEMEEFNLGDYTECSFDTTQLKLIARKIEDAPSVIPKVKEGEWIPCSERLPREYSDDERVLATTDVDGLGVILIPAYDVKSWYRKGYITAWMPLPEPWKGADDES